MQHFGPGAALEWHVTLIHVPCSFESFVRMYQPHPSLVPLHLQHFLEPLSHCLDPTLFVPRLPMAIFWNLVQICWPHPFVVSLTPVAMFWIPSLNILTSFSVPPPEESTFQSIPTLWHLFRSIPIEMPHPHPAAFLFKCDPVQMPQSAPCGTFSNHYRNAPIEKRRPWKVGYPLGFASKNEVSKTTVVFGLLWTS